MRMAFAALVSVLVATAGPPCFAQWKPAEGPMTTRWAKDVSPDRVHPEYPRPQMVRPDWQNLNGLWDYAIRPKKEDRPAELDGQILVPFPVESALSGVMKTVGEANRLWYRRSVAASKPADGSRVLLHFGAVDWHAVVWVNGRKVGEHKGGYDPFTFDVTDAITKEGEQEIVVAVWDPTDTESQARGKQVSEPKGIWYTAVTGLWRTVWLETVPGASIARLKPVPDVDAGVLRLSVQGRGTRPNDVIEAVARDGDNIVASAEGTVAGTLDLKIDDAKLWSPDSPFLYDLTVRLKRDGQTVDQVTSYFGMRKISLGKDQRGFNRLLLNDQPLFQFGPLDQGWWPDGLYTAPTDEALRYDVEVTKKLGFNMARKHVKVEPARWYYHCDKLGLLVWQDMPSGFRPNKPGRPTERVRPEDDEDWQRDEPSARQFERELRALIDNYQHFPSIVMWVPFNEGWGQYDTHGIAAMVKALDPSRLVNATSGWTDRGAGDVYDAHMYPGPGMEPGGPNRAAVLGEFGGLGLPVEGHLWWNKRNWGYRTYETAEELRRQYGLVVGNVYGMLGFGLSAAIYTQTTDVEGEINGLMTYDRAVVKYDFTEATRAADRLYGPIPESRTLSASSRFEPQSWRYTFDAPGEGWREPDFDDSSWHEGAGPLAWPKTPFFPLGTPWKSKEIWIRRTFDVDQMPDKLWLEAGYNAEPALVYLNGRQVAELSRASRRHYHHLEISQSLETLVLGKNTIAAHATKPTGERAIDVGVYGVYLPKP